MQWDPFTDGTHQLKPVIFITSIHSTVNGKQFEYGGKRSNSPPEATEPVTDGQ